MPDTFQTLAPVAGPPAPHTHDHDTELTGVTPDDHHAQAHLIDGADHTGSLAHTALDTVGVDDHHARDHSIIGATHTGFPGGTTNFLRADATFAAPPGEAVRP